MQIRIKATPKEAKDKLAVALSRVRSELVRLASGSTDLQKSDEGEFRPVRTISWRSLTINIEQDRGDYREWHDPATGKAGRTLMLLPYGEVAGSMAADGDPVDVFVGPDENAPFVFVVHQRRLDTGHYDEDKVMLGFSSPMAAKYAYLAHYDSPEFFMGISMVPVELFEASVRRSGELLQPALDGLAADAEADPNLTKGEALFITQSKKLVRVERRLLRKSLGRKASDAEASRDRLSADVENGANLGEGFALPAELERLLEVPVSRTSVMQAVLGAGKDGEIGDVVVCPIPVAVVDDFVLSQLSSEVTLHDHAMLESVLAANSDNPVAILVRSLDPNFVIGGHAPDRNVQTGATGINTLVGAPQLLHEQESVGAFREALSSRLNEGALNRREDVVDRLKVIAGAEVQMLKPMPGAIDAHAVDAEIQTAEAKQLRARMEEKAERDRAARQDGQPKFVIKQ